MLKCSDVSWYRDTFGVMHRYSYTLYRPISEFSTRSYLPNLKEMAPVVSEISLGT